MSVAPVKGEMAPVIRGAVLPLAAFILAAIASAAPILAHLHLPLVDLPNHIARLHVAAADGSGPLAHYYSYTPALVPNSAADLIWRGLGYPGQAERFAQILMAISAINLIAAAMALARVVHGRWTIWSAAVALLVFSGPFFWGFQNFVFSLPFCLYGMAMWLALETRPSGLRLAIFLPVAAGLYLFHFYAFAILAIAVFGREMQRGFMVEGPMGARFLRLSRDMIPFALPVLWLAGTILTGPPSPAGSYTSYGGLQFWIMALMSPLNAPNTGEMPIMNGLGAIGLILLGFFFFSLFLRRGPRLSLAPRLIGPAVALAVAAILAPFWLNGVAFSNIRVPVLLCALLIAGSVWRDLTRWQGVAITTLMVLLIAARGVAFDRFAAGYEADVADMLAATETLPAGARVLPLRAPGREFDPRFFHLQGLLVARRNAFVPTLFQGVHAMQVRDRWQDYADPLHTSIGLRRVIEADDISDVPRFAWKWERKFTHALLMGHTDSSLKDDPRLAPVSTQGRFTLFRIVPEGTPD